MSNKISARNKKAGISPSQETKRVVDTAAYRMLGARLGYIAGTAIDPAKRTTFEQDLTAAVNEAIGLNAPAIAISVLDGFTVGYDKAKAGE